LSTQKGEVTNTTGPGFGPDDLVIVPLVWIALAARKLARATLTLLVRLLDYAFPILLQLMRFPLFTLRIVGDGIVALFRAIVGLLPVSRSKRDDWRAAIARRWTWVRRKISYQRFERAIHHAFENGMAWVFKTCKALTPRAALLVILAALLWLPVSFAAATAMHAILLAKAATWPAWVQLLHPVATIIAKTKLLVLPVYPAAWPQAKKHPIMQALFAAWKYVSRMHVVQKAGSRYRQADAVYARGRNTLSEIAERAGFNGMSHAAAGAINATASALGHALRAAGAALVAVLRKVPLAGSITAYYAALYAQADHHADAPLSQRAGDFFARWSAKFTAEYYETREQAGAKPETAA
jgi:hypothetical protein